MSGKKIKAKDLSYQAPLPPFLQALHAQVGGTDRPSISGPKRAVKKRSGSEEAEDVPLVVDEDGNVVSVEVDKEGAVKDSTQVAEGAENEKEEDKKNEESSKATFGGRKRKVGKVIGGAAEEDPTNLSSKQTDDKATEGTGENGDKPKDTPKDKKPKKKAKKIKLSFDEEDG